MRYFITENGFFQDWFLYTMMAFTGIALVAWVLWTGRQK